VKVPVAWLRELVEVPVDTATLARDLHMTGFEVASASDEVIDFEITANRPDCLSLLGLAREVATRYDTALRLPRGLDLGRPDPARRDPLQVTLEDPVRCPRYAAAIADVTIGPSPAWLTSKLTAAGVRSINNIVDVTNYVLLESGHPMHAFDLARLAGPHIRVRLARSGETLRTLDGQPRALDQEMLVIADDARPQALAGVMGGAESEVSASTTAIVLESAWFLPTSIRRTSRKLGLSSEASYRFERGADFEAAPIALARALALIEQISAGSARPGWIDACPEARAPKVVRLELARVARVLGAEVSPDEVRRILTGLGFVVDDRDLAHWTVSVPSWRIDVARDVDLIEDVARHYGYDRLPTTFPPLTAVPAKPDVRIEQDRAIRRLAAAAGFNECVTFSFIAEKAAREFTGAADLVPILNPLSETFAVLRPSLLPGLVDSLSHNRRHGQRDVRLFELGTRFLAGGGERRALALGWLGAADAEHWSAKPRAVTLFDLKGVVEAIGQWLGLTLSSRAGEHPYLVRGRTADIVATLGDGATRAFGHVGQLLPALATARDVPEHDEVYVAELDIDEVADLVTMLEIPRARPLPRFPSVVRDLSVLVANTLPAGQVSGTIQTSAPVILVRVAEFDRYQGPGVPDEHVSLAYRLTFQAPDRTLTDAEVDEAMNAIVAELARAHAAVRR
jgi:phenylalanyl-tRNA synthetase beta chain